MAFDENRDDHIDFKEMACGISACCRGPMLERQKCEYSHYQHIYNYNVVCSGVVVKQILKGE